MPRWLAIICAVAAVGCDEDRTTATRDGGATDSSPDVDQRADVEARDAGDPRQALRQRSLFKNGSFEQTASSDQPASWTCQYGGRGTPPAKLCAVEETGTQVHGKRHLALSPQCVAYQDVTSFDQAKHVQFDLFAARKGGIELSEAFLYVVAGAGSSTLKARTADESAEHPGWRQVKSLTHPLQAAAALRIVLYNPSTTEPLLLDDVIGLERDTPTTATGHLLRAEHATQINCKAGASSATIWLPLPLDHGVQVPLHVGLSASQGEPVYELDAEGNLGVEITFKPSSSPITATITWTGVVLTREVATPDLAALYPEKTKADTWLASTAVVDTAHQGLKAAALQAVQGATSADQKLQAILKWTSTHIDNDSNPFPGSLDAVTAFTTKAGSCTAYANLAAAAGRVASVPARSVANYIVGMAQQTHSINELYLGSQLGWRLVEPQTTATTVPADYAVIVRLNMPDDEGTLAMSGNHGWSMPGVPSRSLVHPVAGDTARCTPGYVTPTPFPECPQCDNKAFYQAPLLGPAAKTKDLFERARKLWQATLARLTAGGPDAAEQKLRAVALEIRDTAALEQLIQTLEQAR